MAKRVGGNGTGSGRRREGRTGVFLTLVLPDELHADFERGRAEVGAAERIRLSRNEYARRLIRLGLEVEAKKDRAELPRAADVAR